uniref:Class II aldolase/adducin N-terminal domain-containing protein n=1 Tax=Acrobeloides nanus TaxID=290746 RepID=A0A914EHP8_9BILA
MPTKKLNGTAPKESTSALERSFINLDPDDPEYVKEMQRPAAIKEDLNEMGRRKRVQQVLESKDFCKELGELIKQESVAGTSDPDRLARLSALTLPAVHTPLTSLHNIGSSTVVPIADLRGNENYSKIERIYRNKLASLYRLVDLFQWSQGIYNHITMRLPDIEPPEILINPFGLLYHEITASSLIKINLKGEILDPGSTKLGVNQAGYVLHSAIHESKPGVRCILHMHTAVVSAVSSMKCGLLPLCQEAMIIGPVAYHEYQGILDEEEEKESIVRDLGDKNVMLLRNHGFVACGESVEDALHLAFHVIIACETQIRAARAGIENLIIPDEKAVERAYKTARQGGGGVNKVSNKDGNVTSWRIGELEWEAWMRVLDSAGFRTGHIYRQPLLRAKNTIQQSHANQYDITTPPAASSVGLVDEGNPDALAAHRIAILRKEQEKIRWLNSPNNYQKVELLETGTDNPKRITKWVPDTTPTAHNGIPIKIPSMHHFSPRSIDPKEFKQRQKEIKENRRKGTTSAGPQSQILDGVTYEDLSLHKDTESSVLESKDHPVIIGTASKGIIDRQYQHNAQVYRQLYAPNPFASETDEEIQKYFKEVEMKSRSASAMDRTIASSPLDYTIPESPTPEIITSSISLPQASSIPSSRYRYVTRFDETNDEISTTYLELSANSYSSGIHSRYDISARSGIISDNEADLSKASKKKKKKGFFSFIRSKS